MSHGSSSGSIDEEAIHYLRTRGIELPKAKKLLINGFLNEIFENISDQKIKIFLKKHTGTDKCNLKYKVKISNI